jgi:putative ABC transport system substrate-binding protein
MKRRDVTRLLGGVSAIWSFVARAQPPAMPVIGFLHSGSPEQNVKRLAAFRKGLETAGFIEGRNVAIEFRWAAGQNARLPEMAADLIARQVAAIVTLSSTPAAVAAKAATGTIPIFFVIADPPVELGLVETFNRPGGNATGIITLAVELIPKRLELLREMVPRASSFAVLVNPSHPSAKVMAATFRTTAGTLGARAEVLEAISDHEIETAYAALKPSSALLVATDPSFFVRRAQLIGLSARHAVPAIYDNIEFAVAGGLMSYGANIESLWEQGGLTVARILKGEKPANLPVAQPTKFELTLNLRTAKALGLEIPPKLQVTADEVIE